MLTYLGQQRNEDFCDIVRPVGTSIRPEKRELSDVKTDEARRVAWDRASSGVSSLVSHDCDTQTL